MKILPAILLLAAPALPAAFPDFAPGSQAAAMGEAVGMLPGSLEASWYNPAALNGLPRYRAIFSSMAWTEGSSGQFASLGWHREAWPVLGLGYAGAGSADTRRDADGRELGGFEVQAQTLRLNAATAWRGLAWGMGWEMDRSAILDRQELVHYLNAGVQASLNKRWLASASLRRWALALGPAEPSPAQFRAGLGFLDAGLGGLFLSAEISSRIEDLRSELHVGAQYKLGSALERHTAFRLGYNSGLGAAGGLAGFSAGAGMNFDFLGLDYAWLPLGPFGDAHRFSLTFNFD